MTKRISVMLCLTIFFSDLKAQQEWGYTQYLFNLYDVNSAYAGNQQSSSFAMRYRSQWVGMDGAPVSQQFSVHAPVMQERLGIGMKILNESIGARKQQIVKGSCAYKLRLTDGTLSFGIAAGVLRQAIDRPKLTAADPQDAQLSNLSSPVLLPIFDASIFYNTKKMYVGIESSRINKSTYDYDETSLARLYYNMNFTAGYMKKVQEDNMLQISSLIKYSEGRILQAELNLLYLIHNKVWFGGGYRFMTGYQFLASVNITTHLRMGFSYDIPASLLRNTNDGSAEVFLGYNLKNRSGKSIRYF